MQQNKPYAKYKDSGIPWIGQIPTNWDIHRVKYHFQHNKRIVGIHASKYERLALTMHGVIKRSKEDNEGLQPEDFTSYQVLRQNELVFKLIDLQNISTSRVGISPYEGLVSPAYIILHARSASCPKYAYYFFLFMWLDAIFNSLGDAGVRSSLNAGDLLNLPMLVPSLPKQRRIADFLDKKCAEVEELSSNIQKQIEALEQYKRAVITETVTKGLNPSAPMKDSGISWIGQIPAHWNLKRLKRVVQLRNQKTKPLDQIYIALEHVNSYTGTYSLNENLIPEGVSNVMKKGDLLFAKLRPYLAKAIVSDLDGICSSEFLVIKDFKGHAPFLLRIMLSHWFINLVNSSTYGTKMPRANWEFIGNVQIPLPPKPEQQAIADYLDKKCAKIDGIIQAKQQQLEELDQYKKAIIFEYVTGKKQVPEVI